MEALRRYSPVLLERESKENCEVRFSLYIAITVITYDLVKAISMFTTLKTHKQGALITFGDAIESFLDKEDVTTCGLSIYSADRIHLLWNWEDFESKVVSKLSLPCEKILMEMKSKQAMGTKTLVLGKCGDSEALGSLLRYVSFPLPDMLLHSIVRPS